MLTLILSMALIIGVSFICSLCEAILLSLTPAYIAVEIESSEKSGRVLKNITDNIDRSLSAILTLKIISYTLGSAWLAYEVQKEFGESLLTVFSIFLTLMILIFSEILPKTIGKNNSKSLALFAAHTIQVMIITLYPIVKLSELISQALSTPSEEPDMTRDEMIKSAEIGVEEGTIKSKESDIIKNLMKLDKIYISDIMTPRSVITALDSQMTVHEVAKKFKPIRFSRIPVYEGSMDKIVGLTHRYKILEALSQDLHHKKINELMNPISAISERTTVSQALDLFVKTKDHLAIVTDDYGAVTGLATLEDTVETLLGVEIVDEFDNVEDMRKYALEQWQQRKKSGRK
jgi:CBS domain containing-hemolysin-like protein